MSPEATRPPDMLRDRTAGVLLHVTSLPGPHGSGDLGEEARTFARFLHRAGQRWWQMLPIGPAGYGDSPYSAQSAFAVSPCLVDLDALGIDVERASLPSRAIDFEKMHAFRAKHLRRGFEAFLARGRAAADDLAAFRDRHRGWVEDFALFAALKKAHGGVEWTRWEEGVRLRRPAALAEARRKLADEIDYETWLQWVLDRQWMQLRALCNELGIGLLGDIPIFVAHDSADVWQHRELFDLDDRGMPRNIAGVPPDYFSATGQRWGNPLYRWTRMKREGYRWWIDRFRTTLERFDAVRLDHFIGFVRYWRVPAHEETAMNGRWIKGPGKDLFEAVRRALGRSDLPLVAEDLGAVTPKVTRLRRELGLPGIRLAQFAFGDDPQAASFMPYNHPRNAVVYTGTHDNDTIVGWWASEGGGDDTRTHEQVGRERKKALAYLGREASRPSPIHWDMIRLVMGSVARTCIVPMQDFLGLGSEARMNRPGQSSGNWRWRLLDDEASDALADQLRAVTRTFGRDS